MTKDNDGWETKWPSGLGWFDKPTPTAGKDITKAQAEQGLPKDEKVTAALTKLIKENWIVPTVPISKEEVLANWPSPPVFPQWLKDGAKQEEKEYTDMYGTEVNPVALGVKSPELKVKHKIISQTELKSQGSNLVDSEAYLYFQCEGCGTILDPHTKSFATLQEHRVNAGWACKWNIDGMGYKVYCAECREKK